MSYLDQVLGLSSDAAPAASAGGGGSLFERALAEEGTSEDAARFMRSLYAQESGSGSNTKTSNAGATGGMQIIPSTFKSVADDDWDIRDPMHNARAGIRYGQEMLDRANGDHFLAAAGYYGGPGGMDKAAMGVGVADPRNPNAPDTLAYARQVAARSGGTGGSSAPDSRSYLDQVLGGANDGGSTGGLGASGLPGHPEIDALAKLHDPTWDESFADASNASSAELGRLGNSVNKLGRSLVGGTAGYLNRIGVVSDSTLAGIDDSNDAAFSKMMHDEDTNPSYQATTTTGKVVQGVIHMAPAIAAGLVNPALGLAAFGGQSAWDAGTGAIDAGDSLGNAQLKAIGQGALNTVLGGVVGGAGNVLLAKIPMVGKMFAPSAADTLGQIATRIPQGVVTMAVFKPAGTAIDQGADLLTGETKTADGKDKEYDYMPNRVDLITGGIIVMPHAAIEYAARNKMPAIATQFQDGTTGFVHANGTSFSSEAAAKAFISINKIDGATAAPLSERMQNPDSKTDKKLGYIVKLPGEVEPMAQPHDPAAGDYSNTNPDAALAALDKAGNVDEAIAAANAANDTMVDPSKVAAVPEDRASQVKSLIGSDALREWMSKQNVTDRASALGDLALSTRDDVSQGLRNGAVDRLHERLTTDGVFDTHAETGREAANAGTPEHQTTIKQTDALLKTPEWQASRDLQPENLQRATAAAEAMFGNTDLPAAYRAKIGQTLLDHSAKMTADAERAKNAEVAAAEVPSTKLTPQQKIERMAQNSTDIKTVTAAPGWRAHLATLAPEARGQLIESATAAGNKMLPADVRMRAADTVLQQGVAAGIDPRADRRAAAAPAEVAKPAVVEGAASKLPAGAKATPEQMIAQGGFAPEHGTITRVDPNALTGKNGTVSKGMARFLQVMGRSLGKEVHFFTQDGATARLDGFAPKGNDGAIFLNVGRGDAAWHFIAGHEFFHQMPEDIKSAFIDSIKPEISKEDFEKLKAYINQPELAEHGQWEEIAGDLFGNRFGEAKFWDRVLGRIEDPTVAQRLIGFIRNFIDKIAGSMGKGFETDRAFKDLDKVRDAAVKALHDYLVREHAGDGMIDGRRAADFSIEELARLSKLDTPVGVKARIEAARRSSYEDHAAIERLAKAAGVEAPARQALILPTGNTPRAIEGRADLLSAQLDARRKQARGELLTNAERTLASGDTYQANPDASIMIGDRRVADMSAEELDALAKRPSADGLKAKAELTRRSSYADADAGERLARAAGVEADAPQSIILPESAEVRAVDYGYDPLDAQLAARRKQARGELLTPAERALVSGDLSLPMRDSGIMIGDKRASEMSPAELDALAKKPNSAGIKAKAELKRRSTYADREASDRLARAAGKEPEAARPIERLPEADAPKPFEVARDPLKEQIAARQKRDRGELLNNRERSLADAELALPNADAKVTTDTKFSAERKASDDAKRFAKLKWETATEDMLSTDLPNGWTATIYHGDGGAELSVTTPDGREMGAPREYTSIHEAMTAAPGHLAQLITAEGVQPGDAKFSGERGQVNTPEFKKWFSDSKVVDEGGKPLVVYHGTTKDFTKFQDTVGRGISPLQKMLRAVGMGTDKGDFFFAANPDFANAYAGENGKLEGGNVVPTFLRLQDPAVFVTGRSDISLAETMRQAKQDGKDGVIVRGWKEGLRRTDGSYGPVESDVYIVFDPTQIKSAIGNNGEFDGNNADIRASKERVPQWAESMPQDVKDALRKSGAIYDEKTLPEKVEEIKSGIGRKLVAALFDSFAPIKDQLGKDAYMQARMAKAADGTVEATMLYGAPVLDADGGIKIDLNRKGFVEVMKQLGGEHERFMSWLAGMRAKELKGVGRENLFTDDDISALATLNRDKMPDGSSREALYTKVRKEVMDLNKAVLDIAEQSGVIDGASRKVWESDFYVPFYRVMEDGKTGPSIKSGLVNQETIKRLKGGTNELTDLTKNLVSNWASLISTSAKNRAAKASLDKAVELGVATEASESIAKQLGKAAKTPVVTYLDEGLQRHFIVEDPHLLAAISAMEFNGYNNAAMKTMAGFKNALTRAVTISPAFKMRNLIRDSVASIALSDDVGSNPFANVAKGYSLLGDLQTKANLVAGGGVYRFGTIMDGNRAEHLKGVIDRASTDPTHLDTGEKMKYFLSTLLHKYENAGDMSENVNRATVYQNGIDRGLSHFEASFNARDMMDFGLSGGWDGVRALNQILPFFNARLQGLYKLGRAYDDNPQRVGMVIGAVALASISLLLAYKDDPDFQKLSDAERNSNWWFKVGKTAFTIPKPFEVGAMGSAIEHLFALGLDSKHTDGKRFAKQLGDLVSSQLAINPMPQFVRPLMEVYSNKDGFTGRPIESQGMSNMRPQDRYSSSTSELARLFGKVGIPEPFSLVSGGGYKALSPVQIDSLIKGYFSGAGVLAVAATDSLLHHTVVNRGAALPLTLRDKTFGFAQDLPANSSRYVDMLYTAASDIEQIHGSFQNAVKSGDMAKAQQILRDEAPSIAKYHLIEAVKKQESALSQEMQRIRDSKIMSGEAKQQGIRRLKQEQDAIARTVVK